MEEYEIYLGRCKRNGITPLDRATRERYLRRNELRKQPKGEKKNKERRDVRRSWVDIQREYLRWRKTDDFKKWQRKQFLKQGGTCYYCDDWLPSRRINVEHMIPKSKGGDNRRSNLVLACASCNTAKGTSVLTQEDRRKLKDKNQPKKGTYLQNKEAYEYNPFNHELRWLKDERG